jgi:hypothetical protein
MKLMTSLSGSIPAQAALADYLQQGGNDRHLRRLRETLKRQKETLIASVIRNFPTRHSSHAAGRWIFHLGRSALGDGGHVRGVSVGSIGPDKRHAGVHVLKPRRIP